MQKNLSHDISLSLRLKNILGSIEQAKSNASRKKEKITLVAVSKGQSFEKIVQAYKLGQRDFGESYAQEFIEKKIRAIEHNMHDIKWHFIGGIQSNKLKLIKEAHVIHSISKVSHAKRLSNLVKETKDIFLQINLDDDKNRKGFSKDDIYCALKSIRSFAYLNVLGLMAIVPQHKEPDYWFKIMHDLKKEIKNRGLLDKVELSMGMSNDYISAIKWGASVVRVGSALFAPR